ncbi:FAD-dependent oxidoreductase [Rhodoblastus sp.]|uniref:FAD-dependent oxidoreductase n=2 Tax=Rhodoblastus sp. TaxID=1962975 RepID=UPI003F9AF997
MSEKKPGVYLCKGCGIADAVDVGALEKVGKNEFRIGHCVVSDALCSAEGVASMQKDVADGAVNRMVVGACSPRVMADKFRFDGVPVVRANLREQVAWSQPAHEEDTEMLAADVIRMAAAQLAKTQQPTPAALGEVSRTILVVGGGVTGLTAALEAAQSGYDALVVEKSDALGGWSTKWTMRAPHAPPYRDLYANDIAQLIAKVQANTRIRILTNATVAQTSGQPGAFDVVISHGGQEANEKVGAIVVATGWRPYDATKLTHLGYGASPDVVTGVEFEAMLARGAAVKPSNGAPVKNIAFVQCAGSRDPNHLPYCSSVCCTASIKQALQVVKADKDAMAYIVYEELRTPGTAEEFYREAQRNGVVFMKGKATSVDGKAMTVSYSDEMLGQEVPLGGLDLIVLATGMVPNSTNVDAPAAADPEKDKAQLTDDINPVAPISVAGYSKGEGSAIPAPWPHIDKGVPPGGPILNLQYRQGPHIPILADGFSDSHYICFPYETRRTGIYTAGPVRRPMDMAESAEDATGAVLKAIQALESGAIGSSVHPRVGDLTFPKIGHDKCTKCRRCTVECPFGAIDEDEQGRPVVNFARCRRCGTCMGACPVQTITFDNYNPQMVNDMIEANEIPDEFSEKPRILVLACENDAYPAIDMAGIARSHWSPFIRIVPVRCLGSVTLQWVSTALQKGYDGMMLMGCKSGDDYQCHFVKGSALAKERLSKVGETLKSLALEQERIAFEEMSIADSCRAPTVLDAFAKLIGDLPPNPMKGF